jgi:hypothetical protein
MGKNSDERLPVRTPKELSTDERIIYHPELPSCPYCGGSLMLYNHLAWDKTVQTLDKVLSIASRPGHCGRGSCSGYSMRLLSAQGQQIALPGSTYGYDVIVRIGWLRREWRATYPEIQAELSDRIEISVSQVSYLYKQVYLPLLACHEREHLQHLETAVEQHQGLIIALDGLAPEGGEPQLWFIRELLTGLTLRSGWLSQQDQPTFEAFLRPLTDLPGPILAVISDKQRGLVPAVAEVLPGSCHQFCQAHYLKNLSEPLAEADEAFKVRLRKNIRQEAGEMIRSEKPASSSEPGVLTITGLLPEPLLSEKDSNTEPRTLTEEQKPGEVERIVVQLIHRTRYLLTLKGRSPFRLAGIEMYQCFQEMTTMIDDMLAHRYEPRLADLAQSIKSTLLYFAHDYQDLQQGALWLYDIADILRPYKKQCTAQQAANQLQTYLDDLLELNHLTPCLQTLRHHLCKVTYSYWPGLFHCYDLAHLPPTNNALESHFRDIQRQLLRTTGQKGQARRALQRIGAWELLPKLSSEKKCLDALRQIPHNKLQQEQQRFLQHQERFQFHTRSSKRTKAQFNKIRQKWLALPPPTG